MPGPSVIVLRLLDHRVDELLVDRPLHEDAAARRADLALVDEDAEQRAVDRGLEVGVGEEDVRRLAAELERDLLQRVGRAPHDDLADLGAAGERDLVDVRVRDDRRAGRFADARDDVDDAGRQPRLVEARASSSTVSGVCSAGLSTIVQPAQIAGASFHAAISSG